MLKRFKLLNSAVKLITPPSSGTTPPTPPVINPESPLGKYRSWKAGEREVTYVRTAESLPGELVTVSVFAFADTAVDGKTAADNSIPVTASKRALDNTAIGTIKNACNHVEFNPEKHLEIAGFKPAKVTVRKLGAKSTVQETSKLTGRKYTPRDADSYTLPMGGTGAIKSVREARKAIITAAKAITTGIYKVSFTDERTS